MRILTFAAALGTALNGTAGTTYGAGDHGDVGAQRIGCHAAVDAEHVPHGRTLPASQWLIGAAVAYLVAAVAITGGANIPISATIDALDPDAPDSAAQWHDLYTQLVRWNHLRVLAAVAAAIGFTIAHRRSVSNGSPAYV